jgi:hypothetical protein
MLHEPALLEGAICGLEELPHEAAPWHEHKTPR